MKKVLPVITVGIAFALLLGIFIVLSTDTAAAGTLCDRYSSLSRIFPGCTPTIPPPPPADVCPNVPGDQASGPCAEEQCRGQSGTWNGSACELPPPPPPSDDDRPTRNSCERYLSSRTAPLQSCDVCHNVAGVQISGPCADKICVDDGGTWTGTSCELPPPPLVVQISPLQFAASASVDNNLWGRFLVNVSDGRVLLGPTSFTIAATGMDQISSFSNVHLDVEAPTHTVAGSLDVALVNGVATVMFTDQMLLGNNTVIRFHAAIPSGQRFKVQNGATITVSANPSSDWTATAEASGANISLSSVAPLNMGTVSVTSGGGAGGGGGGGSGQ